MTAAGETFVWRLLRRVLLDLLPLLLLLHRLLLRLCRFTLAVCRSLETSLKTVAKVADVGSAATATATATATAGARQKLSTKLLATFAAPSQPGGNHV